MGLTEARALAPCLRDGPHICNDERRDFSCLLVRSSPPLGRELEAVADSIVHYICGESEKGEVKFSPQVSISWSWNFPLTAINPRGSRHPLLQQILIQVPLFDILKQSQLFYRSITFEQGMHPSGSVVKNLLPIQEMWAWSLGREDPLEEEMATPSILARKTLWTEESGGLQSIESQRVRYNWAYTHALSLSYATQIWNCFFPQ